MTLAYIDKYKPYCKQIIYKLNKKHVYNRPNEYLEIDHSKYFDKVILNNEGNFTQITYNMNINNNILNNMHQDKYDGYAFGILTDINLTNLVCLDITNINRPKSISESHLNHVLTASNINNQAAMTSLIKNLCDEILIVKSTSYNYISSRYHMYLGMKKPGNYYKLLYNEIICAGFSTFSKSTGICNLRVSEKKFFDGYDKINTAPEIVEYYKIEGKKWIEQNFTWDLISRSTILESHLSKNQMKPKTEILDLR